MRRTPNPKQARNDRKAAERAAVIAARGLHAWAMPGKTVPNKKREAARKACRGKVDL